MVKREGHRVTPDPRGAARWPSGHARCYSCCKQYWARWPPVGNLLAVKAPAFTPRSLLSAPTAAPDGATERETTPQARCSEVFSRGQACVGAQEGARPVATHWSSAQRPRRQSPRGPDATARRCEAGPASCPGQRVAARRHPTGSTPRAAAPRAGGSLAYAAAPRCRAPKGRQGEELQGDGAARQRGAGRPEQGQVPQGPDHPQAEAGRQGAVALQQVLGGRTHASPAPPPTQRSTPGL